MDMKPIHLVGLLLWRGGVLIISAAVLYEVAHLLLRFIDIPVQLEVGLCLAIAGAVLVLASLIIERICDSRKEGYFKE